MVDITRTNFHEYIDKIKSDITTASFISVDTEFSGLCIDEDNKESMLDTPSARYQRLRSLASKICLFQCGITTFRESTDSNEYEIKTYNFNLFPSYIAELKRNDTFYCQASCIEFLLENHLDFNKCFQHGINYYNREDELNISRILSDDYIDQHINAAVNDWMADDTSNDFLTVDVPSGKTGFIMLRYLQRQYPDVKISLQTSSKIKFEKQSEPSEQKVECKHSLLDEIIGFSCIFRHLVDAKRPIAGHNCFLDLLFLFEKLYMPLPKNYISFKAQLHEMFPIIIDTKYLYRQLSLQLDDFNDFPGSLSGLYNKVCSDKFAKQIKNLPVLTFAENFTRYINYKPCHEAGYDSYMCGVVVLYLAHFISAKAESSVEDFQYPFCYYLQTLEPFTNKINMIRASTPYTDISTSDPKPASANWIFAKAKSMELEYDEISSFISPFSDFEIFRRNSREALIALRCSRTVVLKVLKKSVSFKDRINFTLEPYSVLRHSLFKNYRTFVYGAAAALGITAFVVFRNRRN